MLKKTQYYYYPKIIDLRKMICKLVVLKQYSLKIFQKLEEEN